MAALRRLAIVPHRAPPAMGRAGCERARWGTQTRSFASRAPPAGLTGVVSTVAGDAVVVQGLADARASRLVTFSGGGVGYITELRREGAVRVAIVAGSVLPAETVLAEDAPASFPASSSVFGRVIDPLGRPLDGLGPIVGTATPMPLFPASSPLIPHRTRATASLATGVKVLDALYPLIRGHVQAITGERGVGKSSLALDVVTHVARVNDALAHLHVLRGEGDDVAATDAAGSSAPHPLPAPMLCVYVAVGVPLPILRERVTRLRSSGALAHTCVIAAPAGSHSGAAYLSPFAGAALGDYLRDTGRHVLVVWDGLGEHVTAARRVSGVSEASTLAAPVLHGSLFDRAAQLSVEQGGGSFTGLALIETLPESQGAAALAIAATEGAGRHVAALLSSAASLADSVVPLSSRALGGGALVPLAWDGALTARGGHAAQGAALRHYACALGEVLADVRETAASVAAARALGVVPEAETDAVLDLMAKARLLLLPTRPLLRAATVASGAKALAGDNVTSLGLEGVQWRSDGEGGPGKATTAISFGASNDDTPSRRGGAPARAFSTMTPRHPFLSDEKRPELLAKLDAAQLRTLAAVRSQRVRGGSREHVPAPPLAARVVDQARLYAGEGVEDDVGGEGEVGHGQQPAAMPPFGAGRRSFSTTASRPRFVLPSHADRTTPAQAFALTPPPPGSSVGEGGDVVSASVLAYTPHSGGDPCRTLLTLFVLTHGYVSSVPLHRVAAYEDALWTCVSRLPAPEVVAAVASGGTAEHRLHYAPLHDRLAATSAFSPPAPSGIMHAPLSSAAVGYTSLLDALLVAPVPPHMAQASLPPVAAALRAGLIAQSSELAVEVAMRDKAREEAEAAHAAEVRRIARTKSVLLRTFFDTTPPPPPPTLPALVIEAAPILPAHVRLPPSLSLTDLPPHWALLHVVVSEFTRSFV